MDGTFQEIQNIQLPGEIQTVEYDKYRSSNMYQDKEVIGWVILCLCLTLSTIIFILLWAFCINDQYNNPSSICFGPFGIETGVDASAVNKCGTSRSDPCIFAKNTLADCETECNNLQSFCNAFTFNFSTSTMKIVQSTNTFLSPSTNLFKRQSGVIY